MIAYFDTSAFLPLVVDEAGSARCRRLWDAADQIVVTRLVHVEVSAALAAAERLGRITSSDHDEALFLVAAVWRQCNIRELDAQLMVAAGHLARRFGLRGYDAVHCAAAAELSGDEFAAASGDQALLKAWNALGLTTMNPNAPVDPP
ncbi:type II toxin-antitoxin system VapC family toxin [Rathayibacter soli]|uniref:type II toxin-antitoxin system VapC family toxin n=1 Tax=Rathayibacter soli TaxID=3144168 RepID=UPI0027E4C5A2|nr:type II toxin-antitoxin system VapC family toxin [Glaciibacter superstes]